MRNRTITRNKTNFDISCDLSNKIQKVLNSISDTPNYIHNLLISPLSDIEKEHYTKDSIKPFIKQIIIENHVKDQTEMEIIATNFNIVSNSFTVHNNLKNEITKCMKEDELMQSVKRDFIATWNYIMQELDKSKEYVDNLEIASLWYGQLLESITPEFYYILQNTNIYYLATKYTNKKNDAIIDIKFKIVNPLSYTLKQLLIEEKANFFDDMVDLNVGKKDANSILGQFIPKLALSNK